MGLWNDWNTASTAHHTKRMAKALEEMNKTQDDKEADGCIVAFVLSAFAIFFFPPLGLLFLVIAMIWGVFKLLKRIKINLENKRHYDFLEMQKAESDSLIAKLLAPYPPGNAEIKQKVRDMIPKLVAFRNSGEIDISTFQDYLVDIENGLKEDMAVIKTRISSEEGDISEQVDQLKNLRENTSGQLEVNLHGETSEIKEQLLTMRNAGVLSEKEYREFAGLLEEDI